MTVTLSPWAILRMFAVAALTGACVTPGGSTGEDVAHDDIGVSAGCGVLRAGDRLLPGQAVTSCDGRFKLVLQTDSNLVLYQGTTPLWNANTAGKNVVQAVMQGDGNFVVYDSSVLPIWYTSTGGHPGAHFNIQDDGNGVIYDSSNHALWATSTVVGHPLPTVAGVYPYAACKAGDPEAKLLDETAPPATMTSGQKFNASLTFANCGQSVWSPASGYKLGSQAPTDNLTWGGGRFALPGDVANNQMVRIDFPVIAPAAAGAHEYQWALLQEGVRWLLNQPSALRSIDVVRLVTLCPTVQVDAGGGLPASAALQTCLDALPSGGTLELPAGTYRITTPVTINKPVTLRTAGTATSNLGCLRAGAPSCAVLRASADFNTTNGFVQIQAPNNVTLDHLVFDGNRGARLGSAAASACAGGNNRMGFNMIMRGTSQHFTHSASINALCGTSLEWYGDLATIVGNTFAHNGQSSATLMWSDGLTLLHSNGAIVTDNVFTDNSDVDLIVGGATNAQVLRNRITHAENVSFAGLMLDNFGDSTAGDFRGALVSGNVIDCGPQMCHFGINLGPHPWYLSANIVGGTVTGNTVLNARQGLNIDGAGTAANPIVVYGNTVTGSPATATFNCGVRSTSNYNIAPDSIVDRRGDTTPVTNATWHICP